MLAFKEGVRLNPTSPVIQHCLHRLGEAALRSTVRNCLSNGDLTITSGNDGVHSQHSQHYRDTALDIRVHNVRPEKREWLREFLEGTLNRGFDGPVFVVLYEHPQTANAHYHVQIRIGETFPDVE